MHRLSREHLGLNGALLLYLYFMLGDLVLGSVKCVNLSARLPEFARDIHKAWCMVIAQ